MTPEENELFVKLLKENPEMTVLEAQKMVQEGSKDIIPVPDIEQGKEEA